MEEKWIPEQGELIEVKMVDDKNWLKREFIATTGLGFFLCWTIDNQRGVVFDFARKVQEEPIYYYRYKKLIGNKTLISSCNFSDKEAEKFLEDGCEKILSTRTKYKKGLFGSF